MVHQVGLVIITIPYQASDLSLILPSGTFTKHYHRDEDNSQLNQACMTQWLGGVCYVGL